MKRVLLTVQYDGTAYAGWQRQLNGLAVQQVLEEALSEACGESITVTGASRTDAGVHARGQRAHFDTGCGIPADKFPFVLNHRLPEDIRVVHGMEVPPAFHARFLSDRKIYHYRMLNSRHGDALLRRTHNHVPVPMDVAAMRSALPDLIGTHDFAAFQASGGTAKTTVRTLTRAELEQRGDELILTVEGNAFLYNMVRIIAGTLIDIGLKRRAASAFAEAIRTGSRLALGATAPAKGLELALVDYPPVAFTDPASIRWHKEKNEQENEETDDEGGDDACCG